MSAKFIVLGKVISVPVEVSINDEKYCQMDVSVRRNFRDYDGVFRFDNISIMLGMGISKHTTSTINNDDVVQIIGRIQNLETCSSTFIAEQLTVIKELESSNNE